MWGNGMIRPNDERIVFIADHYGFDAQSRQLIEEMAELTAAINHFWRKVLKAGEEEFTCEDEFRQEAFRSAEMKNMIEEIADVEVGLAKLRYMIGLDSLIDADINMKISRQISRILQEEYVGGEAWNMFK